MSDEQVPPAPPDAPPPPPPAPPPPPPAAAPPPPAGGSENRTAMIILSYLWLLSLIPFLVEKDDREVQWHAKHGLVLTGAEFVVWIVLWIVHIAATAIFAPIGCVTFILLSLVGIGLIVFHVLCMVKGTKGERMTVPYVSEFAERF